MMISVMFRKCINVSRAAGVTFTTWKRNRCFLVLMWKRLPMSCQPAIRAFKKIGQWVMFCLAGFPHPIPYWRNCQKVPFEDINILNPPHSNDNPRQFICISMLTKMFQVLKETSICVNCKCWEIYCRWRIFCILHILNIDVNLHCLIIIIGKKIMLILAR